MFWPRSGAAKNKFEEINVEQTVIDNMRRISSFTESPAFRRFIMELCKSKAINIMLAGGHVQEYIEVLTRLVDLAIILISTNRLGPSALNSVFDGISDYLSLCLLEAVYEVRGSKQ